MSDFALAIPVVLAHEGGLSDDPDDHGGATNFGLTLKFINANVDPNFTYEELVYMTKDEAEQIYLKYFWNQYNVGAINSQAIATKLFDTIVNVGPSQGVKLAQKACCDIGKPTNIDGKIGPSTIGTLNTIDPTAFLTAYRSELAAFYEGLVAKNPTQEKFLHGWLSRAAS